MKVTDVYIGKTFHGTIDDEDYRVTYENGVHISTEQLFGDEWIEMCMHPPPLFNHMMNITNSILSANGAKNEL